MNSLDTQIGGKHYKCLPYQPVKFSTDLSLNFIQGNIVKYVTRYKTKNGKEDLEKVLHYAQLGEELDPKLYVPFDKMQEKFEQYVFMNNLEGLVAKIIKETIQQNWSRIIDDVTKLIEKEYETVH